MFFCKFCEIFKNTFFIGHLRWLLLSITLLIEKLYKYCLPHYFPCIFFLYRRLLRETAAKVLIQLCAALFVVIIVFVMGIEQVSRPYLCTSVAVMLHYFTLVTFMWMLMEAGFMYHAFVRVWPPTEGGDIYKSTVTAWGKF